MPIEKLRNGVGSVVMAAFGFIALYRFRDYGFLLYLLVAFRDFWAAWLFWVRKPAQRTVGGRMTILSFVSAGFPLLYFGPDGNVSSITRSVVDLLAIGGYMLSTLAMIELGRSFGVAPAVRGERIGSGPYRFFKHPMYVGYAVAEVGAAFFNPLNAILWMTSVSFYFWRMKEENRLFLSLEEQYRLVEVRRSN